MPSGAGRIVVISNPVSGRGRGRVGLAQVRELVNAQGGADRVEYRLTTRPGEALELARAAALEGAEVVAAAGGDGTVGDVVNGIMGTGARLAVLPLGTGNDLARHLGLVGSLATAVTAMLSGRPYVVDVGKVRDRWFINVAGCGFDALVAQRVNRGFRWLRGAAAYTAAMLDCLKRFKPVRMRVELDDEILDVHAMLCTIANSSSYGGGMRIAPDADMADGVLDVCLLHACGKLEFLRAFPQVFAGNHVDHRRVSMYRSSRIVVHSEPPMPLLVDGEVVGTTPAEFVTHRGALEVLVP